MSAAPHHEIADDRTDDDPAAEIGRLGPAAWLDDIDLHHDLRDARRVLRIELHRLQSAAVKAETSGMLECPWPETSTFRHTSKPGVPRRRLTGICWFILCCGAMSLVCGGVLLGLSHQTARPDLWSPGLLAAVAGQFLMVLALIAPRGRSESADATDSESIATRPYLWRVPLDEQSLVSRSA